MTTTKPLVSLAWHHSDTFKGSMSAHRGHVMFWGGNHDLWRRPGEDPDEAYVSFRIDHECHAWTLRVWTHDLGRTLTTFEFDRQRDAKIVAEIIAAAIAARFDGTDGKADHSPVRTLVEDAERAGELWAEWPDQRDASDVERLAKVGVEVTL